MTLGESSGQASFHYEIEVDFWNSIPDLSPLGQTAAVEATVAEPVTSAAEVEVADAVVEVESVVDADAVDAG